MRAEWFARHAVALLVLLGLLGSTVIIYVGTAQHRVVHGISDPYPYSYRTDSNE